MENGIASWLNQRIKEKGWSIRELARRANIAHTSISRVISGELSPTWEFCAAVAGPLNESPIRMFQMAGLLPNGGLNSEITYQEILQVAKRMTRKEREEWLRYAFFLMDQNKGK